MTTTYIMMGFVDAIKILAIPLAIVITLAILVTIIDLIKKWKRKQ